MPYFDDEWSHDGQRAARGSDDGKAYYVPEDMTYPEWKERFVEGDVSDADFMGKPRTFETESFKIKAYEVDSSEGMFTQTHSVDAQNTIEYMKKAKADGSVEDVSRIVIADKLPGIAAYDHETNVLYVNERLSNTSYLTEQLSTGYFVAENADDVIKHEMFHKKHWDFIKSKGGDYDIIKNETEADLHKYVSEQLYHDRDYIKHTVSENASDGFAYKRSLNELIADVQLQDSKGIIKDETLLDLVNRYVK